MSEELGKERIKLNPMILVNRATLYEIRRAAIQGKGFKIMGTKGVFTNKKDEIELTLELELEW